MVDHRQFPTPTKNDKEEHILFDPDPPLLVSDPEEPLPEGAPAPAESVSEGEEEPTGITVVSTVVGGEDAPGAEEEEEGGVAPEPPARDESCANPTEGGEARKTE